MTELITIQELQKLANLDFRNWNEEDVREDYVKPLLNLLGYEKDTDYDINREGSHILQKPFLMIGRKRIEIDYELVVRKQKFWIIETKAGKGNIKPEDILQAHFYAIHPEVGVPYFAVTNGWAFKLFDVREIGGGYRPILEIKSREIPNRFNDLRKIVGAGEILKHRKTRLFNDFEKICSVEIVEENPEESLEQLKSIAKKVRPKVLENWSHVYREISDKKEAEWEKFVRNLTPKEITVTFDFIPKTRKQPQVRIFEEKIGEAKNDLERARILSILITTLRGRPTSYFRINALQCLILIYRRLPRLKDKLYFNSVGEEIKQLIKDCLSHFQNDKLHNKLWILETIVFRFFLKVARINQTEFFKEVLRKKKSLSEEEKAYEKPSMRGEIEKFVRDVGIRSFYMLSHLNIEEIEEVIKEFESFEKILDKELQHIELEKEVKTTGDMFWGNWNVSISYLRLAVLDVINTDFEIIKPLFDEEIVKMIGECAEKKLNFAEEIILKINREYEISN